MCGLSLRCLLHDSSFLSVKQFHVYSSMFFLWCSVVEQVFAFLPSLSFDLLNASLFCPVSSVCEHEKKAFIL